MNTSTSNSSVKQAESRSDKRVWLHPALKAALWVWCFYVVEAALNTLTLGLSTPFTLGFQLFLSGAAGALAGWLHDRESRDAAAYDRLGALAGITLPVLSLPAMLVLNTVTGLAFSSGLLSCLCLPVTLHFSLGAGWLGGALYERVKTALKW